MPCGPHRGEVTISLPRFFGQPPKSLSAPPGLENVVPTNANKPAAAKSVTKPPGLHLPVMAPPGLLLSPSTMDTADTEEFQGLPPPPPFARSAPAESMADGEAWLEAASRTSDSKKDNIMFDKVPLPSLLASGPRYCQPEQKLKMLMKSAKALNTDSVPPNWDAVVQAL